MSTSWNPQPQTLANAKRLHDTLHEHGRLTKRDWADASGLHGGAFDTAKAALDHVLQVHLGQPTAYDPRDWSYFLPASLDDARPWLVNRLGDTRTRATTIQQTLLASAQAFPEHEQRLRWWATQLDRLAEDVETIMDGVAS